MIHFFNCHLKRYILLEAFKLFRTLLENWSSGFSLFTTSPISVLFASLPATNVPPSIRDFCFGRLFLNMTRRLFPSPAIKAKHPCKSELFPLRFVHVMVKWMFLILGDSTLKHAPLSTPAFLLYSSTTIKFELICVRADTRLMKARMIWKYFSPKFSACCSTWVNVILKQFPYVKAFLDGMRLRFFWGSSFTASRLLLWQFEDAERNLYSKWRKKEGQKRLIAQSHAWQLSRKQFVIQPWKNWRRRKQ